MKKNITLIILLIISIISTTFFLTSCNKAEKLIYKVENITYDGQYITWNKTELADYYYVQINGGDKERSNSTTYAYASTDTFEVTITAVSDGDDKASDSVTFKPLSTIENIVVNEAGELSWDPISGANAYSLLINGENKTITDNYYNKLSAGNNRIKVKPIVSGDNSFYSKWSTEINTFIYESPSTIKYDGVDLTWTGNATEYQVTINGNTQIVRGNSFNYNSNNRDFSVEIKAIGNHTSTYDSKIITEEFHYLNTVTEIFVEDGIVKWNAVDNAEGYKIKIDGIVLKDLIIGTEYDKLPSGKSQDVAVMPYNNSGNYFSSWSAEKTIYILDTPLTSWNNDLELDGEANNNLTWNAINAANGYTVRLIKDGGNPEIFTYSDIQRAFAHAYTDVGVYTIEVKANASTSSADYYDSKYSAPITVERLSAPKPTTNNFIVSDKDSLSKGFTVNFIQVNAASGYQLYKDGVLLSGKYTTASALSDNNVADLSNVAQQEYTYMVRSMGGVKTISGKQYVTLPSLTANSLSFNITVQATPQNLIMSGFNISWDAVAGNNGYVVAYSGSAVTAQTEQYDLSTIKAGSYSITISTRGNGGAILPSSNSSPVNVERLEAPTNIKIKAEANGTLQWDDVSNAKSYEVYLDLSSTPLNASAYGNMYQFIETNGTPLSMIAVANYYNNDNTVYYMTSETSPTQQFIRLAAPTFPEGALANSIELLWNAPNNINTSEYTPTYRVYSAIGEQIGGGDLNATKFNIEYLEGGNQYNFYIRAIGNDTKYLDSEYSVVITAYKINTPTFSIHNGQYVWNAVTNASSYYLEIDGEKVSDEYHVSGSTYYYTPLYTVEGNHIVKLKALGDGRNNLDSCTYSYTQKTKILQAPVIEYNYSNDPFVDNGSIVVNIKTPSINCNGYQYEIAGQSITSLEESYTKVIQNPGKYSIRVKALGGLFDSDDVYYIDSQYAGGSSSDVITLLAPPSNSSFSINSDGAIKWDAVSDAYGYEYYISYDNGDFTELLSTSFNVLNIINYKQYKTITIKIRAKGDGIKTISSQWIEWTWTNSSI